mgnify:CR=1 FL=1
MAKSATIQLKKSATANAVPTALAVAEPALNTADKKLYSSDGSTVFQVAPSMTEHAAKASLASPTFTGTPTTPTPATDDNSTKVANTSWVRGVIAAISAGVTTWMGRSGNITAADVAADVNTAFSSTTFVAGVGAKLGAGNALLYADGDNPVARSGAAGSEKYFRFESNGNFRSVNGGLIAENGSVHAIGGSIRSIRPSYPHIIFESTGNAVDAKKWIAFGAPSGQLIFATHNDAESSSFNVAVLNRDGSATLSGPMTVSGLKWSAAINLAAATNLDTITVAGFYDLETPVNGPPGATDWIYLEVQRHSGNALWCLQRATRLGADGNKQPLTWQRIYINGVWAPWYPVSGFVSPQHYGADGDGIGDDTVALTSALNSGLPVFLAGLYRTTALVSASLAGRNGLLVYGTGSSAKIILDSATARLEINNIDPDNPWGVNQDQVILRDFVVMPTVQTSVDVLTLSGATGDMGSSSPGMEISNVHITPLATDKGSSGAQFRLHNMRNGKVRGCTASGRYYQFQGVGLDITSDAGSAGVEIDISECNMNHLQTGYRIEASGGSTPNDDPEGISIHKCRGIAVDRGVWASNGPEDYGGWLIIADCHMNFREKGIYAPGIRLPMIHHNYLLAQGTGYTTVHGIDTEMGQGLGQYGSIDHNRINFEGCSAATRVGIRAQITPGQTSNAKTLVSDNMAILPTTGYDIAANNIARNNDVI